MSAAPDDSRPVCQLSTPHLERYGNQLTRCLKTLGTDAPIRADVQRELAAVRAEQDARAAASEPDHPCRPRDVSGQAASELERTRRQLAARLAVARPDSLARAPMLAHITAIDTELARRTAAAPAQLPGPRAP
jgi:hypothetical protein